MTLFSTRHDKGEEEMAGGLLARPRTRESMRRFSIISLFCFCIFGTAISVIIKPPLIGLFLLVSVA